jgi:hypothetical protein
MTIIDTSITDAAVRQFDDFRKLVFRLENDALGQGMHDSACESGMARCKRCEKNGEAVNAARAALLDRVAKAVTDEAAHTNLSAVVRAMLASRPRGNWSDMQIDLADLVWPEADAVRAMLANEGGDGGK